MPNIATITTPTRTRTCFLWELLEFVTELKQDILRKGIPMIALW